MSTDSTTPSVHALEVVSDQGELSLRLVCHAVKGATCRRRPANEDVEQWGDDYAGEMVDSECWATVWASEAGFDDGVRFHSNGVVAAVPVTVSYDECVLLHPVEPHTTLVGLDAVGGAS